MSRRRECLCLLTPPQIKARPAAGGERTRGGLQKKEGEDEGGGCTSPRSQMLPVPPAEGGPDGTRSGTGDESHPVPGALFNPAIP